MAALNEAAVHLTMSGTDIQNGDGALAEVSDKDFSVEMIEGDLRTSVVVVHGEADVHTARALQAAMGALIEKGAQHLVVDLAEATFIDSTTLGLLLGAVKRLRQTGGTVSVACAAPHIRRTFEMTLLDRIFSIHPSREAALAGAGQRPG
jgi:anti-sigma B factor antagonist